MQWVMFSKMLAPYSVPEAGRAIRDLGFEGVDLTVRPGGHVLPEAVTEGLPAAVEALRRQGMDRLAPMIALGAVKAMVWERQTDPQKGDVVWPTRMVPLREGAVRWREVLALLKQIGYEGPVSFHSEYQGGHSWRDLSLP